MARTDSEEAAGRVRARIGPRPTPEPPIVAMFGGLVGYAVATLFCFLVSPDPDPSGDVSIIVALAAAATGFLVQWSRHRWYDQQVTTEFLAADKWRRP